MYKNLVILVFSVIVISGCKAQSVYTEDVSQYRPSYDIKELPEIVDTMPVETEPAEPSAYKKDMAETMDMVAEFNGQYDYMNGYRIQIYVGTNENVAQSSRSRLRAVYDDEQISCSSPEWDEVKFRVKAGDFVDRLTAYRWFVKLKKIFPRALLVPEKKIKIENVK